MNYMAITQHEREVTTTQCARDLLEELEAFKPTMFDAAEVRVLKALIPLIDEVAKQRNSEINKGNSNRIASEQTK